MTSRSTVLILVATGDERDAVLAAAKRKATVRQTGRHTTYLLGPIGGVEVVLAQTAVPGSDSPGGSAQTASSLIDELSPRFFILAGICYGLGARGETATGGVLLAQRVIIPGRARASGSPRLFDRFMAATAGRAGPAVHPGPVVSADSLPGPEPDAIAWEREGAGVYDACAKAMVDWIVVKGVAEWRDGRADAGQREAARNAAEFVIRTIAQGGLREPDPPPPPPDLRRRLRVAVPALALVAVVGITAAPEPVPQARDGYVLVHSARTLEVQPPEHCLRRVVDLDLLTTSIIETTQHNPAGTDFVYDGCSEALTTEDTRVVALGFGRTEVLSPDGCATAAYENRFEKPEPATNLKPGTVLCAITDRGSVVRMVMARTGEPFSEDGNGKPTMELSTAMWMPYPPRGNTTWLVDVPVVADGGGWERGRHMVAGTRYARSYTANTALTPRCADSRPTIAFDLAGQYKRFTVTVGISNSAPGSPHARFWAELDGRPLFDKELALDQKESFDVSVVGGSRLRLNAQSPTCGGYFVFADGRLRR